MRHGAVTEEGLRRLIEDIERRRDLLGLRGNSSACRAAGLTSTAHSSMCSQRFVTERSLELWCRWLRKPLGRYTGEDDNASDAVEPDDDRTPAWRIRRGDEFVFEGCYSRFLADSVSRLEGGIIRIEARRTDVGDFRGGCYVKRLTMRMQPDHRVEIVDA